MPATSEFTVKVSGLREFQQALRGVSADLRRIDRATLRAIGKPIAQDAERLAAANIRNLGSKWARMRVGLTSKLVYIAPGQRGTRHSDPHARPNLAALLMDKAMEPALALNEQLVIAKLDAAIAEIATRHGF